MILELKVVSKSYQQGSTLIAALKEVSFNVASGESIAVVGPSGSGKTTLLSILAGLESVDQGSVTIEGTDITQLSERELGRFRAKNLGIIFQQFHLMPQLTAIENVALPLELSGELGFEEKAREALRSVGLGHRENHLPEQLSGGECQRVAIARAYVVKPKILLADEPSGNLDTETGNQVMDLLFNLVQEKGSTLIFVTHDESLASKCSRTISISGGMLQ